MTVNTQIDHAALGDSRIATEYKNAACFRAYIAALMAQCNEMEALFYQLAEISNLDTARGVNLDVIGEIVGISRIIPESVLIALFGFEDQVQALGFGEEGRLDIGGRFMEETETGAVSSALGDNEYRLIIRAKIAKNHSKGTNEDVIAGLSYLFDGVRTAVIDLGGMAIGLFIGRFITQTEKALLGIDLLPRPAGVKISFVVCAPADGFFGFDDQIGARGFDYEVGGVVLDGTRSLDGSWIMSPDVSIPGGVFAEEVL